jgi:hypothetical protein
MSKYKTIETQYRTLNSLLAALRDMGYTDQMIQVAQNPHIPNLPMFGYHADLRPERASVCIPRKYIGSASNDVGFAWNGSAYQAIISEFDMHASSPTSMNVERQAQLKQRYAYHEATRIAKIKGYTVQEAKQADGTIRLTLTHR